MYRWLGVALALGLVSACSHPQPHRPGEEFVETIRFEGNQSIGAKELRDGLALHRAQEHGAAPDPYLVAIDGERVRGIYLRHGFLEVRVHSRVDHQGAAATVVYRIDEGPHAKTRVEITGLPDDPALPASRVRGELPLRDGAPFEYEPYDQAKEKLLGVVEDAGYAHARLDAHVVADRATHEAVVELAYDTGPKCHFGAIEIDGTNTELVDAVRRRLAIATGQTYSTAAIANSQRAIYDMKRFSTVRIVPDKTGGDTVNVRITLSEGSRNEVALGGGFGIDPVTYEIRGRAGYSILGWPTPLTNLDIDTRPAYAMVRDTGQYEPRARAVAKLTRIDLFHPFITGEAEVGYDYMVWEAYTSYGPHLRLGLQTPLGTRALKLRVGWMIEDFAFTNLSTLVDPMLASSIGLDRSERVAELQQALVLDLRDSPIEPHLGLYAAAAVNEGATYFGGAENFTQAMPEVRGYVPIGGSIVVAARARAGAFWGDVPVTERYFAGGASSNRGFGERQLSPTLTGMVGSTFEAIPIGGGALVDSSVEVRAKLGSYRKMGIGGVVFLDGADVEDRLSEIQLGDLYWAVGTGVRLFTAVGAIGIDFGYRLNRFGAEDAEPGSRYAFHLSLGEAY